MNNNTIRLPYATIFPELKRILQANGFTEADAHQLAKTFTDNSEDGVYTHGLNRFSVFIEFVQKGYVKPGAVIQQTGSMGALEQYDGDAGAGILNGLFCADRSVALAAEYGIGCVAIRNTNHWMRGGTYGWRAADKGYAHICFTNTHPLFAPWGGVEPKLGNNPLIIAVPKKEGHIVLDMALSLFSMGKVSLYNAANEPLPYPGGYDEAGNLSQDAAAIVKTRRLLPIGFYKGAGLSLMLDLLVTLFSKGDSTAGIAAKPAETGISQVFISMKLEGDEQQEAMIEQILAYTKSSTSIDENQPVRYPGEGVLKTRAFNKANGIPVDRDIWDKIVAH